MSGLTDDVALIICLGQKEGIHVLGYIDHELQVAMGIWNLRISFLHCHRDLHHCVVSLLDRLNAGLDALIPAPKLKKAKIYDTLRPLPTQSRLCKWVKSDRLY